MVHPGRGSASQYPAGTARASGSTLAANAAIASVTPMIGRDDAAVGGDDRVTLGACYW